MSKKSKAVGILIVLCMLITLVLSACSSGSPTSSPPASASKPSAAPPPSSASAAATSAGAPSVAPPPSAAPAQPSQASSDPIKIGYITTFSGPFAMSEPYYTPAVEMLVENVNKAGGLLGRQVQLIKADDGANANTAILRCNDLLSQGVIGVTGTLIDNTEAAVAGWAGQNKVPAVLASAGAISLRLKDLNRYSFYTSHCSFEFGRAMALSISKKQDVNSVYFIGSELEIGHSSHDFFWENMKKMKPGVKEAGVTFVAPTQSDYTNVISAILAAKPDLLICVIMGPGWISFIQQAQRFDLFKKMKVVGTMSVTPDVTTPLGKNYPAGIETTCELPFWINEEPMKSFSDAFLKRTKLYANDLAIEFYNSAFALLEGIKKAGSTDREKITDALTGITIDGPAGKITYRDYNHQANSPTWWVTTGHSNDFPIAIGLNPIRYQDEIYMTKEEAAAARAK
jgi:branched-chain amino acid transport system substrate-binding protein